MAENIEIKSPYNFVPAPEEKDVFKPDWASQVSHDIPFSDGESGEIELKITAMTPIFIRNGHSKEDAAIFEKYRDGKLDGASEKEKEAYNRYLSFSNIDGRYFIPGTSLKGMFRNVMEIITYARLKTEDDIFSFRNLKNDDYKSAVMTNRNIKTGWLMKRNGNWIIKECEHKRILIWEIEKKFNNVSFRDKSAVEKYEMLKGENLEQNVAFSKNLGRSTKKGFQKTGELYTFDGNGKLFHGTLVFFGSMNNKKYEYIFGSGKSEFLVSKDLMDRFIELEDKNEDSLFKYLANHQMGIPVFFCAEYNSSIVSHFGFSRLYKLSNTKRLHELKPISEYGNDLDLPSVIFGGISSKTYPLGLKGRVNFGNAQCSHLTKWDGIPVSAILNNPKASYFPFYLKNGQNYLNVNAELSGFKKYPLHNTIKTSVINDDNQDIITKFNPLGVGTTFKTKIRFHNLKKNEIGALLSAITFHGNNDNLTHNIGGAKPLGYGKIKISEVQLKGLKFSFNEYLESFEVLMEKHKEGWLWTERMNSLVAMAQFKIGNHENSLLVYPQLEFGKTKRWRGENEFLKYNSLPEPKLRIKIKSSIKRVQKLIDEPITSSRQKETNEKIIGSKSKFIDASSLKQGDFVYGEIIEKNKPFSKVKLMLNNYNFDLITDLTGLKQVFNSISVGQIVKCQINSFTKEGKISMVKYIE